METGVVVGDVRRSRGWCLGDYDERADWLVVPRHELPALETVEWGLRATGCYGSANGLASWLACADGDQPRRVDAGWINLVRRQMNGNVRGCPVSQGGLRGGGELGTRVNFGPANDGT